MSSMPNSSRRGGVYLAVAGTVTFVTLIGVAGLAWWARADDRVSLTHDERHAEDLARAGIELGIERTASDPDWRKTFADGGWNDAIEFAGGSVRLQLSDEGDGRIEDDLGDDAVILARAKHGRAARQLRVEIEPMLVPINALETAIWSDKHIAIEASPALNADLPLFADEDLTVEDWYANADLQSDQKIEAEKGARSQTIVSSDLYTRPDWGEFSSAIKGIGTEIPRSAFGWRLQDVVLSDASNPFGTPDPDGIYWINGRSNDFVIRNVRIVGTLIVFNAEVTVEGWQLWEQTDNGWPVFVCERALTLATGGVTLFESLAGFNVNPTGTPYEGEDDDRLDDSYPCRITGLVVGLHHVDVTGGLELRGTLVVKEDLSISNAAFYVRDEPDTRENPPPGFREETSRMRVVDGSWSWVTD